MYRVMAFLALLALCGCSQSQLEHQTDAFNRASATTIGEQTLLNAVRSSLDLPMSFTKLHSYKAESMAKGTLAPIPLGAISPQILGLGPTINLSGGANTIEYVDVNNSGALGKLNQNVGYDTIDRYAYQGLHFQLLNTIFVEYVEIHGELSSAIGEHAKKKCDDPAKDDRIRCDEVKRLRKLCARPDQLIKLKEYTVRALRNRAQDKCEFLLFQLFRLQLALSGYLSDLGFDKTATMRETTEGKLIAVPKTVPKQVIHFRERSVQEVYQRLEDKFKKEAKRTKQDPKQALKYTLRSPKSLLTYLGELIALQNFGEDKFVPAVMIGREGDRMTVFRVIRGQAAGDTALSIRGPDGEMYSVPRPDYASGKRDQTLRVLGIAAEVVNGAISEKDFPVPASIVVRAIQ